MDRTTLVPYKAEEKDLSEKLYKKLDGLMLIYPANEELKKHFTKDMFLKPNQAAFFQVFNYLFRIHDPIEYKKRFYWPITDKRGESSFRCSTVEYLKLLSEKHNLNWNIKSYLVQMPGGMKFIVFVLDLVAFIIGEQVRLREKQLGIEVPAEGFSEIHLKRLKNKHTFFKDYTADYISEVERQTLNLRRTTQLIKAEIHEIESEIQTDIDSHFIKAFEESNEKLFESKFMLQSQRVIAFEKLVMDLKTNIDKYQQKALELRKDKSTLRQALQKVNDSESFVKPTMVNLTMAFVQIQPIMETWLSSVVEKNSAISSDMTSELMRLQLELEQIETQIKGHHQKFKLAKSKETQNKEQLPNRNLTLKYVFTPPIKVQPSENPATHLPLLGEMNLNHNLDHTRSVRKIKPFDSPLNQSLTSNRSKIIDPVQMLRTIYKHSARTKSAPSQPVSNLSLLGVKWKERQQLMFGDDISENMTPIKFKTKNAECSEESKEFHTDIKMSSPITPFNAHSDDITRIALSTYKHSPSVKKVDVLKEDAFNIKNLSTSPTGRLENLCFADDFLPSDGVPFDTLNKQTLKGTENNQNIINVSKKVTTAIKLTLNDENDFIFNTSDTVLKDVL